MNYKYTYESPLGTMIMLGTLTYLTDLFFVDESHAPTYDEGAEESCRCSCVNLSNTLTEPVN